MKFIHNNQIIRRAGALLGTSLLLSGASLQAETSIWDGVYVDLLGGFHWTSSGDVEQGGEKTDGSYDRGFVSGISLGKQLSPNWSVELEWLYRTNGVDSMEGGVFDGVDEGDFASTNLLVNAIYTFNRASAGEGFFDQISPYVGAGVGAMQEVDIDLTVAGVEQEYSDRWAPTAQIMAGAIYPISESFSAFTELRYSFSGSQTLESETTGAKVDADYSGSSLIFGLRYSC